jgi:hypothetical protein
MKCNLQNRFEDTKTELGICKCSVCRELKSSTGLCRSGDPSSSGRRCRDFQNAQKSGNMFDPTDKTF